MAQVLPALSRKKALVWRRTALRVRLHWSSLRRYPRAYLQILYWRLRGLRLRSRQHYAALLGRSPLAYDLWLMSEGREEQLSTLSPLPPTFLPIIDCSRNMEHLTATLDSLRDAGVLAKPLLVNDGDAASLRPFKDTSTLVAGHEWLLPLAAGDLVAPDALVAYAEETIFPVDLIYADDDLVSPSGRRCNPHLKPDWNPELFEQHDYVTGACAIRGATVRWDKLPDQNWQGAMVADALRSGRSPVHVPKILHHRLARPEPRLPSLERPPAVASSQSVSVIIPIRNGLDLLSACIPGVLSSDYDALEMIIVDNGSDDPAVLDYLRELETTGVKILRLPGPFNYSVLNNHAVEQASGRYCCFLNNDVEVIDGDWLRFLVHQAERPDIGAVGARLLYPDGTIQHAGVVIGIGGAAGHAHRQQNAEEAGYFLRTHLPQRVSAVTAACMVVSKDKFLAVGGFDEEAFPVAFNDVDLCLRLNERGWHSFYEPRATLIHHESKSRGKDVTFEKRRRFERELAALQRRWGTDHRRDPFHHPNLSRLSETFVLDLQ